MRRVFLILSLILLPLFASAQQFSFGYFSYDQVLHAMPDYIIAEHNLNDLQAKYDAEAKRVEDEFNSKYEEFLDGQKDFAPAILEKRQAELRDLMEKNIAFRENSKKLLDQAKKDAYAPLNDKINAALKNLAKTMGLAFVLNKDNNTVPYVDEALGHDLTAQLETLLKQPAN